MQFTYLYQIKRASFNCSKRKSARASLPCAKKWKPPLNFFFLNNKILDCIRMFLYTAYIKPGVST